MHERNVEMPTKQRDDLLALALAHETVVDIDAGEPVADRLVDEHGRHGGINSARQAAEHPAIADLGADRGNGLAAKGPHGPVAAAAGDLVQEVGDQRRSVRCVVHLGVELQTIEAARLVGDDADGRVRRMADALEAIGQLGHTIAVAHPHGVAAPCPDPVEERGFGRRLDLRSAVFGMVAGLDRAAELHRHQLLAIADAEHRDAGLEHGLRRARRTHLRHRGRAAGEDDGFRPYPVEDRLRQLERHDFAVNPGLAYAARNELRDLRAEVDDENLVMVFEHGLVDEVGRGGGGGGHGDP